jgi:uncharacterized membrane protein
MCIVALLALFSARLAVLFLWLFTNLVTRAFAPNKFLLPLLGLIFLPWTTLMYVLAWTPAHGVTGVGWFFVALGVLFDLGSYSSGGYTQRHRVGAASS